MCNNMAHVKTSVAKRGSLTKDGAYTIQKEWYVSNTMQLCPEPLYL